MMRIRVDPGKRRSKIEMAGSGYRLTVPGRLHPFLAVFLVAWLGAWTVGGVSVARITLEGTRKGNIDWFSTLWLVMWLVGEVSVAGTLAYMVAGLEALTLEPGCLSRSVSILGVGTTQEYDPLHVRNLRIAPASARSRQSLGIIAFDYGARTIRMVRDIEDAEAAVIIEELIATGLLPHATAA